MGRLEKRKQDTLAEVRAYAPVDAFPFCVGFTREAIRGLLRRGDLTEDVRDELAFLVELSRAAEETPPSRDNTPVPYALTGQGLSAVGT